MKKQFQKILLKTTLIFLVANYFVLITTHCFSQGAAINTTGNAADASAMLDVKSNNAGLLIPRLTNAERDSIDMPAEGLLIYNLDCYNLNIFRKGNWHYVHPAISPDIPVSGNNIPYGNVIIWNWNVVSGATGYKYNTINDYTSAVDNGVSTSFTQTGLDYNTSYNLYVWSYNICGFSDPVSLNQTTNPFTCGVDSVEFNYRNSNVTYGTAIGDNNTCWLNRNLGALQVATSYDDNLSYGDYFQWGRLDDGHQSRNPLSGSTSVLSNSDIPGNSLFIIAPSSPYDWRDGQNANLWQNISGINNPCPVGWRIPTELELNNERLSWTFNNYFGAFQNSLKWSCSGFRFYHTGLLYDVNTYGTCWSSTISGTRSRNLGFSASNSDLHTNNRAYGLNVRCIKD